MVSTTYENSKNLVVGLDADGSVYDDPAVICGWTNMPVSDSPSANPKFNLLLSSHSASIFLMYT